jgi:hypothetical protein
MKVRNESERESLNYWIPAWMLSLCLAIALGALVGNIIGEKSGYKQGQIDAIEGRIKYEQTGYVKIKGEK